MQRPDLTTGDGIYKSTDAGDTWRHIGLPEAGQIGRIVVHPKDPDIVYAAVLGHIFGPNPERGVYRSKDGGKTWERVLFKNDLTGTIDMVMSPKDPKVLFAAMWTFERKAWGAFFGALPRGTTAVVAEASSRI